MKKYLAIVLIFIAFSHTCIAKELYKAESSKYSSSSASIYQFLSGIEKQIYSKDYLDDNAITRLERIEKTLYDSVLKGSVVERLQRINTTMSKDAATKSSLNQQVILEMIENKYFNTTFKNEPIEKRLSRLEETILGFETDGDIKTRFDDLTKKIPVRVVGISVKEASSGSITTVKPEIEHKNYSTLEHLGYDNGAGDYFSRISGSQCNKLYRWKDFPIFVYTDKIYNYKAVNAAAYAIKFWKQYLQIESAGNQAEADIIIKWDKEETGTAEIVTLLENNQIVNKVIIHAGNYIETDKAGMILAHQIGHAVGIWGHSDNIADVMYGFEEINSDMAFESPNIEKHASIYLINNALSKRDINTLIKIYRTPSSIDDFQIK